MKILISPTTVEEADIVLEGGTDILDIKNVNEGSLGAQGPWVVRELAKKVTDRDMLCSAAIGDLPYKPGTIGLAAYGAAMSGAQYVKGGLLGATNLQEATEMATALVKGVRMAGPDILAVVSGYADHRRIGCASHGDIVKAAVAAQADVVMLDTKLKEGRSLFDEMTDTEIRDEFVAPAHEAGLKVALAGSVKGHHMEKLVEMGADIVGVRGAVCHNYDRTQGVSLEMCKAFMADVRGLATSAA